MLHRKNKSANNNAKNTCTIFRILKWSQAQQVMGSFIYSKHLQISLG